MDSLSNGKKYILKFYIPVEKLVFVFVGGQRSTAVTHLHCNVRDVGPNPAATRNENGHWETPPPPDRRWLSGSTGSECKTGDVKPN